MVDPTGSGGCEVVPALPQPLPFGQTPCSLSFPSSPAVSCYCRTDPGRTTQACRLCPSSSGEAAMSCQLREEGQQPRQPRALLGPSCLLHCPPLSQKMTFSQYLLLLRRSRPLEVLPSFRMSPLRASYSPPQEFTFCCGRLHHMAQLWTQTWLESRGGNPTTPPRGQVREGFAEKRTLPLGFSRRNTSLLWGEG